MKNSKFIFILIMFGFMQSYGQAIRKRLYLPTIYEDKKLDLSVDNKRFVGQKIQEQKRRLHLLMRDKERYARMNSVIAQNERVYVKKEPARDCCGCLFRACELVLSFLDHLMENNER